MFLKSVPLSMLWLCKKSLLEKGMEADKHFILLLLQAENPLYYSKFYEVSEMKMMTSGHEMNDFLCIENTYFLS